MLKGICKLPLAVLSDDVSGGRPVSAQPAAGFIGWGRFSLSILVVDLKLLYLCDSSVVCTPSKAQQRYRYAFQNTLSNFF